MVIAALAAASADPLTPLKSMTKIDKLGDKKRLDESLIERAVTALLRHHNGDRTEEKTKKEDLLGNDAIVQLQLGLEVAPAKAQPKPMRIEIPYPFRQVANGDDDDELEEPEVCLIVKEESKPWVQELIARFPEHLKCVKKVLGLQSLREKHAQYSQRRDLLHRYTVFMADDRILPMLTTALGKDFFKAKKQPIPVRLTRKEALPFTIQKALASTHMTLSRGTCVTIPMGVTNMSSEKLVENAVAVAVGAANKVPRKWANIRSMSIKTPDSTALPFYNKTPTELLEIGRLAGLEPVWKEETAATDKKGNNEVASDAAAKEKKKRVLSQAKSPLIRALKKQKQNEQQKDAAKAADERHDDGGDGTSRNKSEKKRKAKDEKGRKDNGKASSEKDAQEKGEDVAAETPKHKKPEKKADKRRKSDEDTPTSTAGRDDTKKKKNKSTVESTDTASEQQRAVFILSKKYKGSKPGYVFKRGSQGIGYYIDAKPEVDTMALEAILRMSAQQQQGRKSGGSGRRSSKRKKR